MYRHMHSHAHTRNNIYTCLTLRATASSLGCCYTYIQTKRYTYISTPMHASIW